MVGQVADDRIEDRVGEQRDHDPEANPLLGQAENLIVVEQ